MVDYKTSRPVDLIVKSRQFGDCIQPTTPPLFYLEGD